MQNDLSLPPRTGPQPATTNTNPHKQLEQIAPVALQEELLARVRTLVGVRIDRTGIPEWEDKEPTTGTRAFVLEQALAQGPREAFLIGTEFGHLHTPSDGSLHLCLPDAVRERALEMGWGVMHPMAGQMIRGLSVPATDFLAFGPRTEDELGVIWKLTLASYDFACGESESNG